MAASRRVSELRLVVTAADYDAALAFYRDALGLPELAAFASDGGRVTILDGGRATLELADPPHAAAIDEIEVGRRVAGHIRVAFEVPDSDAAAAELVDAGAELVAAATPTPWGSRNARLDGPAGLHLTLFSGPTDLPSTRVVVTVIGEDQVGIIAAVSTILAEAGGNILDLQQGVMHDLFVMTLMVDLAAAVVPFDELRGRLLAKGAAMGLQIEAQHEDVFKYMHRI